MSDLTDQTAAMWSRTAWCDWGRGDGGGAYPPLEQVIARCHALWDGQLVSIDRKSHTLYEFFQHTSNQPKTVARLLEQITAWFQERPGVAAIALVGSHARGAARPDSDIDMVILVDDPQAYRHEQSWLSSLAVNALNDTVITSQDEDYGPLWSRRVFLASGHEVEFGFARRTWAATEPLDSGTRHVVRDGCRALYDPHGIVERLIAAVHQAGETSEP
jgi:predicted nucleotidyltransferase